MATQKLEEFFSKKFEDKTQKSIHYPNVLAKTITLVTNIVKDVSDGPMTETAIYLDLLEDSLLRKNLASYVREDQAQIFNRKLSDKLDAVCKSICQEGISLYGDQLASFTMDDLFQTPLFEATHLVFTLLKKVDPKRYVLIEDDLKKRLKKEKVEFTTFEILVLSALSGYKYPRNDQMITDIISGNAGILDHVYRDFYLLDKKTLEEEFEEILHELRETYKVEEDNFFHYIHVLPDLLARVVKGYPLMSFCFDQRKHTPFVV